ncbi:mCG145614, partial [Mus musculus]
QAHVFNDLCARHCDLCFTNVESNVSNTCAIKMKTQNLGTSVCSCFNRSFTAVNRHYDQGNSYKGQHLIGPGLRARGSAHYHQVRSMAASRWT